MSTRLDLAELVCRLSGRDCAPNDADAEKATTQALLEWYALKECRDGFRGDAAAQDARCLTAAEKVCVLLLRTGRGSQETRQALESWSETYGHDAPVVSESEVLQLAARRSVIEQRTLARMRREAADEQERQRRLDFLECLYIEQGGDLPQTNNETNSSGGADRG